CRFHGYFFSSRRRHTRCYRDWSSDVCSSDLDCRAPEGGWSDRLMLPKTIRPSTLRSTAVAVWLCGSCGYQHLLKGRQTAAMAGRSEERRVGKARRVVRGELRTETTGDDPETK